MNNKLLKIQMELKAPKNQTNSFGGYNYRSCEDIFEAVKPLLQEEGLVLRVTDELVNIGERYYIKATAILTDGNDIIENVAYAREEETKKGMDGSQITGASSSYARKYALNGLFLIDDVKDSDTTNMGEEPTLEKAKEYVLTFGKHAGKKLSEVDKSYLVWLRENGKDEYLKKLVNLLAPLPSETNQKEILELIETVNSLLDATDTNRDVFYKHYGVTSNGEMTLEQLRDAVDKLRKKAK